MTTIDWYLVLLTIGGAAIPLTRLSPKKRYQLPPFCLGIASVLFLLTYVSDVKPEPARYWAYWTVAFGCSFIIVWAILEHRRQRVG